MTSRLASLNALFLLASTALAAADAPEQVKGRVVDEAGRAVVGASVSELWGANGLTWDQVVAVRGTEPDKLWRNEGKMQPWGDNFAVTDADGHFSINAPERKNSLLVYDRERRRGALILFDPDRICEPVEVRVRPLVRVFGTTRLAGGEKPLKESCVYLNLPYDATNPLARRRMAICGSFKARFEFLLPTGAYEISASAYAPEHAATVEDRTFTLTAGQKDQTS